MYTILKLHRSIVSSCIAELDLFKLTCKTLMLLLWSRDSGKGRKDANDGGGQLSGEDVRGRRRGVDAAADRDDGKVLPEDGGGVLPGGGSEAWGGAYILFVQTKSCLVCLLI